ncbi:MAG: MerR family transcriptional regulator [Solobacterium sp.]|nr:MerR family transcriptional regulator [Solobacterium sp.]
MAGVNAETIRSYRMQGYLHPAKEDNGYYTYSINDLVSLLWIRKLRGNFTSMDRIHEFFTLNDEENMLELLEQERIRLDRQISEIQSARRFIDLETRHIEESRKHRNAGVGVMQSIDEKVDFYEFETNPILLQSLYNMMTPTLFIEKDILNGPLEDRIVPIRAGVGTYRYVLNEHKINELDEQAVIVPNGLNVTQVIILSDLTEINVLDLAPMMTYAKVNHLTFLSDTTGYLMRIQLIDEQPYFHFRIRACFETNSLVDPTVLQSF